VTDESPSVVYRQGLSRGELLFQRCAACSNAVFYPRIVCPYCGVEELRTEKSMGNGTVYSTTAISGSNGTWYSVCLIDLDEGFRMMSAVVGIDPGEVEIGSRVQLEFDTDKSGEARAVFVPRGAS
jgi:uncharacterized OB-fold protein